MHGAAGLDGFTHHLRLALHQTRGPWSHPGPRSTLGNSQALPALHGAVATERLSHVRCRGTMEGAFQAGHHGPLAVFVCAAAVPDAMWVGSTTGLRRGLPRRPTEGRWNETTIPKIGHNIASAPPRRVCWSPGRSHDRRWTEVAPERPRSVTRPSARSTDQWAAASSPKPCHAGRMPCPKQRCRRDEVSMALQSIAATSSAAARHGQRGGRDETMWDRMRAADGRGVGAWQRPHQPLLRPTVPAGHRGRDQRDKALSWPLVGTGSA